MVAIAALLVSLSGCGGSEASSDQATAPPDAKALRVVDYGFSVVGDGTRPDAVSYGVILRNTSKYYGVDWGDLIVRFYDSNGHVVLDSDDLSGYGESFVADVPPDSPAAVSGEASLGGKSRPKRMTVTVPHSDSAQQRVTWVAGDKMPAAAWVRAKKAVLGAPNKKDFSDVAFIVTGDSAARARDATNIDTQLVFRDGHGDVVGGYPSRKVPALKKESDGWHGSFQVDVSTLPKSFVDDDVTVYLKMS